MQHYETDKHKIKMKSASHASCKTCACGKTFELRSSLFNHKKTCKVATAAIESDTSSSMSLTVVEKEIASVTKKTQDIADKNEELMDLKTMVQMLLNDRNTMFDKNHEIMSKNHDMMTKNQEVLREITQQNQQLIQTIQEMTPRIGSNNVVNTTTHNTQFNLNMFLNNECKDAIKLSDFVKTLKITLQDLEYTKMKGIVEGVSYIIVNNLRGMDVHKRPIHCTDLKRETMYVKADEWIKDDDCSNIKKFIYMASCYQTRIIQEWMDAHPGWETKEKMHVEYQTICKELYKNIECDDHAHKKIIKAFIKEVHIPRTGIQ